MDGGSRKLSVLQSGHRRRSLGVHDYPGLMDAEIVVNTDRMSFSVRLKWFLGTSLFGVLLHILDIVLSVVACCAYVWETYAQEMSPSLGIIQGFCFIFFCGYYLLAVFIAKKRVAEVTSMQGMTDLVSLLPLLVLWAHNRDLIVRVFRLVGVVRVSHFKGVMRFIHSDIKKQLFSIGFTVIALTYTSTAIIEVVENQEDWVPTQYIESGEFRRLSFANAFYFVIMTITTVGYGDIKPLTAPGRLTVMLMMGAALLTIPKQTNKLIIMLGRQSPYVRRSYHTSGSCEHIVVCGALGSWVPSGGVGVGPSSAPWNAGTGAIPFFSEFFHEDHGSMDRSAVIIDKGQPSHDMQMLLTDPKFALGMTYLDGDVMLEKDLRRGAVESAKAVFVFANKFADDVDAEDSHTILRALSIKRYVFKTNGRDPMTCVQLIRPENKQLFLSSMEKFQVLAMRQTMRSSMKTMPVGAAAYVDQLRQMRSAPNVAICIEQIKLQLLAKSCLAPGLPNLLFHLTSSSASGKTFHHDQWLKEHLDGREFEVYRVPLSPKFHRVLFTDVVETVYREVGVVLFALEVWAPDGKSERVILNPGAFAIPDTSRYHVHGYVIAADKRQADQVSVLGLVGAGRRRISINLSVSRAMASEKARLGPTLSRLGGMLAATNRAKRTFNKRRVSLALEKAAAAGGPGTPGAPKEVPLPGTVPEARDLPPGAASPPSSESSTDTESEDPEQAAALDKVGNTLVKSGSKKVVSMAAAMLKGLHTAVKGKGAGLSPFQAKMVDEWVTKRKAFGTVIRDVESASWPITNHIVVCGLGTVSPSALEHLMRPLRAKYLPLFPSIVVLQPNYPPKDHLKRVMELTDVWFVQGSPFTSADLVRAGVHKAVTAVIFKHNIAKGDDVSLVDADTICIYRLMKARNPTLEIVCELISKSSIGYLSTETADEYQTPVFAAGHVYTPALLDILLCQSFYAPHLATIFDHILAEDVPQKDKDFDRRMQEQIGPIKDSHLFLMPVHRDHVGLPYAEVFARMLMDFDTVCMGLRRLSGSDEKMNHGEKWRRASVAPATPVNKPKPKPKPESPEAKPGLVGFESADTYYVYTNPGKAVEVRDSDCIFVLAQSAPYGTLKPFARTRKAPPARRRSTTNFRNAVKSAVPFGGRVAPTARRMTMGGILAGAKGLPAATSTASTASTASQRVPSLLSTSRTSTDSTDAVPPAVAAVAPSASSVADGPSPHTSATTPTDSAGGAVSPAALLPALEPLTEAPDEGDGAASQRTHRSRRSSAGAGSGASGGAGGESDDDSGAPRRHSKLPAFTVPQMPSMKRSTSRPVSRSGLVTASGGAQLAASMHTPPTSPTVRSSAETKELPRCQTRAVVAKAVATAVDGLSLSSVEESPQSLSTEKSSVDMLAQMQRSLSKQLLDLSSQVTQLADRLPPPEASE